MQIFTANALQVGSCSFCHTVSNTDPRVLVVQSAGGLEVRLCRHCIIKICDKAIITEMFGEPRYRR